MRSTNGTSPPTTPGTRRRNVRKGIRSGPTALCCSAAALGAKRTPEGAEVRATVKNTSARDGDEVVQLYVGGGPEEEAPVRSLRGFQRLHLRAGESREVTFTLGTDETPKSAVEVSVGGGQPLAGTPHVRGRL